MTKRLRRKIAQLSLQALPEEVCGVVIDGKAIGVKNSSQTPQESFLIDAETYLKFKPDCIFHSHPINEDGFSEHDLVVAANMELTSYVYVVEADRLEKWSTEDGLQVFEKVLRP
jgi:proteasome lid subunit RPN8/RPN11